jgi:VTC domain
VERKTHRESWKGEESVKERVVLPEDKVVPFMEGEYTVEMAEADLRAKVGGGGMRMVLLCWVCHGLFHGVLPWRVGHGFCDRFSPWRIGKGRWVGGGAAMAEVAGLSLGSCCRSPAQPLVAPQGKSDAEIEKFKKLFVEIQKAIESKQLRPMIRTQYMRTAFQVHVLPGKQVSYCSCRIGPGVSYMFQYFRTVGAVAVVARGPELRLGVQPCLAVRLPDTWVCCAVPEFRSPSTRRSASAWTPTW